MSAARASYTPVGVSGGKFSVRKAVRKVHNVGKKAQKGVHKAQRFVAANAGLIDEFDDEFGTNVSGGVRQANHAIDRAEHYGNSVQGGRFNLKKAARKTVHTARRVKQIARTAAPILSVVAPEVGLPLAAAVAATGGRVAKTKGGSFKVQGGSFRVQGGALGGCQNCPTCGSSKQTHGSESSMIHPMHPSWNPKKPKSFAQLIHEN